jgi:hypothetical protein
LCTFRASPGAGFSGESDIRANFVTPHPRRYTPSTDRIPGDLSDSRLLPPEKVHKSR